MYEQAECEKMRSMENLKTSAGPQTQTGMNSTDDKNVCMHWISHYTLVFA